MDPLAKPPLPPATVIINERTGREKFKPGDVVRVYREKGLWCLARIDGKTALLQSVLIDGQADIEDLRVVTLWRFLPRTLLWFLLILTGYWLGH